MIWFLGPPAIAVALAAFLIILLMSIFGAGSVLVWLRRMGRGRKRDQ